MLALLLAATTAALPQVTIEVDPPVLAAVRGLGADVVFFTSRARPLRSLAELRDPAHETGTGDLALARPLWGLLRAGGVKYSGGAVDLMQLGSDHHFGRQFTADRRLRFFAVRARPDGRERVIEERGGGVRLVLRPRGQPAPAPPAATAAAAKPATPAAATAGFVTSFGPLVRAALAPTARTRAFDPQDGARTGTAQARRGHTFVVVHIDRDLSAGLGTVSYLFGMGVLVKPAFDRLTVIDGRGRRFPLAATFAEGRTLELAYQLPAGATTGLTLEDGDQRAPLGPLLPAPTAANP
jgi:hypothetical protein